jgi:putative membrane protein
MMRLLLFLVFVSIPVSAQEASEKNRELSNLDWDDFVVKAASSTMMEIELGRLARERGESHHVRNLGERMVRDHSIAGDELKNIAQRNFIQLPDSMLEKHKSHVEELSELSASEFDQAYLELLAEERKKDIELFEEASGNYENDDIRGWARKTLMTLRDQERYVNDLLERTD